MRLPAQAYGWFCTALQQPSIAGRDATRSTHPLGSHAICAAPPLSRPSAAADVSARATSDAFDSPQPCEDYRDVSEKPRFHAL